MHRICSKPVVVVIVVATVVMIGTSGRNRKRIHLPLFLLSLFTCPDTVETSLIVRNKLSWMLSVNRTCTRSNRCVVVTIIDMLTVSFFLVVTALLKWLRKMKHRRQSRNFDWEWMRAWIFYPIIIIIIGNDITFFVVLGRNFQKTPFLVVVFSCRCSSSIRSIRSIRRTSKLFIVAVNDGPYIYLTTRPRTVVDISIFLPFSNFFSFWS
mmetsp:Transcript_12360/g.29717  ORF Transcript_12360/g.29717 Transcript_12360/m.29717 type:complete len:209 (+) Transcript_12360:235-861(+)